VVVIDGDGKIVSANRSAAALFGTDELAGKAFADLFAPESQRAAIYYLDGLANSGVASVLNDGREVIGRERGGGLIPLFMTVGRIAGDAGRDAGRPSEVQLPFRVEDVGRQRQEDGAGRGRQRRLGRAVDGARQVLEPPHLRGPFHERARDRGQVGPEDRLGEVEGLVVLARRHQERRAGLLGVVEHAQRVAEPGRHVHVAASLFHDIAPAQELGIPAVWINRLDETSDLPREAELTDLAELPDTLDRIVPAELASG